LGNFFTAENQSGFMNNLSILLTSDSATLCAEVQAGLSARQIPASLSMASSFQDFVAASQGQPFDFTLLDMDLCLGEPGRFIAKIQELQPSCVIFALFSRLDAPAMADAIRLGAASFGLKENLAGLIDQIIQHSDLPPENEADLNIQFILRGFLEESTDSIWVKNRHGRYLLINPAGARFLSKSVEEVVGKTDFEVFPANTAVKIRKSDQDVMDSGLTQTIEDSLLTHDGQRRTFMAVKGVWRNGRDEVAGVIGTVRDITARKIAEETLQQSEERFRRLVEGVKDHAIYLLDSQGLVSSWNIGAERLQGYRGPEILGGHFSRFYPEESVFNPDEALMQATESGYHEQECIQVRRDGSEYWATIIITPLFNAKDALIGFSCVVRDMTRQRQAEEELRRYAAKLEQSNQELEQFAMIASHDLQAPLRKVRLFSEMLEEHTGEEGQDIAKRLQGAAAKMQHFISDLLELSRVNRKGRPFRPVALSKVLERVLEDLEVSIKESEAAIAIETPGEVYGDPQQLEQLCLNLLGNSLKFRRSGVPPRVNIQGEPLPNGAYRLTIRDNGIGFKQEYLEKIFLPFERLHGPVSFPGTGMGLAICKKIVDRHGGQITATGTLGEGATFIIDLPATANFEGIEPEQAPSGSQTLAEAGSEST